MFHFSPPSTSITFIEEASKATLLMVYRQLIRLYYYDDALIVRNIY